MSFYKKLKDDINKILKDSFFKKQYKKEFYDLFQVS